MHVVTPIQEAGQVYCVVEVGHAHLRASIFGGCQGIVGTVSEGLRHICMQNVVALFISMPS